MPQSDSNSLPVLGTQLGTDTYLDNSIPSTKVAVTDTLNPMYSDKWLIGYKAPVADNLNAGAHIGAETGREYRQNNPHIPKGWRLL